MTVFMDIRKTKLMNIYIVLQEMIGNLKVYSDLN